jgi:hypothetical protein
MLPAWAAVAIALGASAVGALAGIFGAYISLRITQLNLDHETAEAWRTRQLEAAEDFSVVWTAAVSSVGLVRAAVKGGGELSQPLDLLQQNTRTLARSSCALACCSAPTQPLENLLVTPCLQLIRLGRRSKT